MHFFEHYYENIVKYDLLNKFQYKKIKNIPKLQRITLNFVNKNYNIKYITSSLIALEIITSKKSILTHPKNFNISLKIKKGNPVGCKITIKKNIMYVFFAKLIITIFPRLKYFKNLIIKKKNFEIKAVSFKLKNILNFPELEYQYKFFKNLPSLNIIIVTNSTTSNEFLFLLKSFKLPIVNSILQM